VEDRPLLLTIAPAWDQGWWNGGQVLAPPLILPLLAGLTPLEFDVILIDENVEPVDLNTKADLVAISCMTASAPRAYEIADAFRLRGIPVVIGGIHPTIMPDEAAAHADAVVIGEAEPVWDAVLADFLRGCLQPRYRHDGFAELTGLPRPRRELLQVHRYLTTNVVQTARGCPNDCSFCTVKLIAGRKVRFRPIEEVIEEVRQLEGWIGFVDDNITIDPTRAKLLFEALIRLNRPWGWVGQADMNMAKDPELMTLAHRSGGKALFMGLESLSQENLRATHKMPNVGTDMDEAVTRIHRAGLEIIGSFVLGFDGDDLGTAARTVEFAERHKLAAAQFSVLTPFPGTRIREQLLAEGRVLDNDWSHYTMSNVVFRPLQMTPWELKQGQAYAYGQFYSGPSIFRRCLSWRRLMSGNSALAIMVNRSYRRLHRNKRVETWLTSA